MAIRPDTLLGDVMSRLLYLRKLRKAALQVFERVGDDRVRVRTTDVGRQVAELVGANVSPFFMRDLNDALKREGWRMVTVGKKPLWKGVRRK